MSLSSKDIRWRTLKTKLAASFLYLVVSKRREDDNGEEVNCDVCSGRGVIKEKLTELSAEEEARGVATLVPGSR